MKCLLARKHIGLNTEGRYVFVQYADTCFYTEMKCRVSRTQSVKIIKFYRLGDVILNT